MKAEAKKADPYVAGGLVVLHAKVRLSALVLAVVSAGPALALALLALSLVLVLVLANEGLVAAVGLRSLLEDTVGHDSGSVVGPDNIFNRERGNFVTGGDEGESRGCEEEDGDERQRELHD